MMLGASGGTRNGSRIGDAAKRKFGRSTVRFERTKQTRQALDEYLRQTGRKAGDFCSQGAATSAAV